MRNNTKPDFAACSRTAYRLLLAQRKLSFPVAVDKLSYERNVLFDTVEHYCQITGLSLAEITGNGIIKDGCTLRLPGIDLILYSGQEKSRQRLNWTLAHEVGHICLEHEEDGEQQEIEAHYFASELLMPSVLIEELCNKEECVTVPMLSQIFDVSFSAAKKRLCLLERQKQHRKRFEQKPEELLLQKRLLEAYNPLFRERMGLTESVLEPSFSQAEEDWLYGFL